MAIPERRYTSTEAQARLTGELAAWSVVEGHLSRDYRVNGFKSALLLANAIGHLAELAWHHPDLVVRYGGLTVRLRTHSADAITEKDFALARRIEEWVGWRPTQAQGPLDGTPSDPRFAYLAHD
ncbi:MAG: 4a-hydroxytetrahydrobiopterin dehydratase [Chromatiales bacterium]|nr:4a-hydroxytetrahydrobiopterin dehydratase [Chromatiales bacterium]